MLTVASFASGAGRLPAVSQTTRHTNQHRAATTIPSLHPSAHRPFHPYVQSTYILRFADLIVAVDRPNIKALMGRGNTNSAMVQTMSNRVNPASSNAGTPSKWNAGRKGIRHGRSTALGGDTELGQRHESRPDSPCLSRWRCTEDHRCAHVSDRRDVQGHRPRSAPRSLPAPRAYPPRGDGMATLCLSCRLPQV